MNEITQPRAENERERAEKKEKAAFFSLTDLLASNDNANDIPSPFTVETSVVC